MRKSLIVTGLAVLVLCLGGCIFIVKDETHDYEGMSSGGTIAEIDAVGKLSFDSERKKGYERIAQREGLSPEAQVYLVEAVLDKLSFDNAKEAVLLALIENPDFSSAAESEILDRIDRLAFESSKNKILKAISDRKN
ncbi:MAG: hypothetical protein JSW59_20220 [Phycisphaerales bacterium]|nr:MAG: hypothetical protein JSW59_20220 [Phycisphaerales bacterium]